jgi:hypothetical protein
VKSKQLKLISYEAYVGKLKMANSGMNVRIISSSDKLQEDFK